MIRKMVSDCNGSYVKCSSMFCVLFQHVSGFNGAVNRWLLELFHLLSMFNVNSFNVQCSFFQCSMLILSMFNVHSFNVQC